MKQGLIDILRCPSCRAGSFSLRVMSENGEIKQGVLNCKKCGQEFKINNGIADLLYNPPLEVIEDLENSVAGKKRFLDKTGDKEIPEDKKIFYANREHFYGEPGGKEYVIATQTNVDDAIPFIKLKGSQRLLELGAGTCWSTAKLAKQGCQCVATDISTELKLELGEAFFKECGIFFERVKACMQNLPFVGGAFDIIFATTTVHHSSDLSMVFKEAARVLKPEGHMYLVNEPIVGILNFKERQQFLKQDALHHGAVEKPYNLWQWVTALKRCGLNPTLYFPGYTYKHLKNNPAKTFLGKTVRIFLKIKILQSFILRWALYPMLVLWNPGICFAITAIKTEKIDYWCRFKFSEY